MLDVLTAEDFEAMAGKPLSLALGDAAIPVEIAEVRRLKSPSPRAQAFAVIFRHAGATRSGPQGLYRIDLPERGSVELFVVPVGPDKAGMCYEAVFN